MEKPATHAGLARTATWSDIQDYKIQTCTIQITKRNQQYNEPVLVRGGAAADY